MRRSALAKALSLNASTDGGTFSLASTQTVNIKGAITTTAGDIDLSESGNTGVNGLSIGGVLSANSGNINLTTTGIDKITSTKTIAANNLTISAGGAVGTSSAGLPTDVSLLLTVNGNTAAAAVNIKDASTLTFTAVSSTPSVGGSVSITSAGATVDIGPLNFSNVTVNSTDKGSGVAIGGAGGSVGDGTGTIKITSIGSIVDSANTPIFGTTVVLASTTSDIGAGGLGGLQVQANFVTANAVKGNVFLAGQQNLTLNTGTALNTYSVIMNPGTALNIGGVITATTKTTGLVTLTADTITQGPATAFLVAPNVSLNTSAGGSIGLAPGFQSIQTKAAVSLSIEGGKNSLAFVTQNGSLTLLSSSVMTICWSLIDSQPGGSPQGTSFYSREHDWLG